MVAHVPDLVQIRTLRPGDVYQLSLPNAVGIVGAAFKGSIDDVFGIDLSGQSAFQVRRLDTEEICTRLAAREKVRFAPGDVSRGVNVPRKIGCVFSTYDGARFLKFALPEQEARRGLEIAYVSLDTLELHVQLPGNIVSVDDKWSLWAGDTPLFPR